MRGPPAIFSASPSAWAWCDSSRRTISGMQARRQKEGGTVDPVVLHGYAQGAWHDAVMITGNRQALKARTCPAWSCGSEGSGVSVKIPKRSYRQWAGGKIQMMWVGFEPDRAEHPWRVRCSLCQPEYQERYHKTQRAAIEDAQECAVEHGVARGRTAGAVERRKVGRWVHDHFDGIVKALGVKVEG